MKSHLEGNNMPQNLKVWRDNARRRLREALGNRCVDCGATHAEKPLMFAHIVPLTDEQHSYRVKIGANARLCLYRKEAREGLLTLRCQSCNMRQAAEPKQGFLTYATATVGGNPF